MNYEEFIDLLIKDGAVDQNIQFVVNRIKTVFADEHFRNTSRVHMLFASRGKLGRTRFFVLKRYYKIFYSWLYENNLCSKEQVDYIERLSINDFLANEEILQYFKDLDDVITFIRMVGRSVGNFQNNTLVVEVVAILCWYGVKAAEMIEIKKSDIDYESNCILVCGRRVCIEEKYMQTINDFANATKFICFLSGIVRNYKPTEYLFRSSRAYKMAEHAITQVFRDFNSVSAEYFGRELSRVSLENNSRFCDILKLERSHPDIPLCNIIEDVIHCEKHTTLWYKPLYEEWKNKNYCDGGV